MNDVNYEKDIELKELFFRILNGWRRVIVVALLFAFLFGGYKCISGMRALNDKATIESQETAYEAAQSTYETNKAIMQKEIDNINTSIERQTKYNEESILMQINPFDEQVANISFYIDSDYQIMPDLTYQNTDIADMVIRSYLSFAQNGDMYNYILKNLSYDIEYQYLKEIISVWCEYESNTISIQVVHSDLSICKEIIEIVRKFIEEEQDVIKEKVGEHSISIINESTISSVDFNRETEQKAKLQIVEDYKNSLVVKQAALSALVAPTKTVLSNSLILKSMIKYSILGFFAGVFLIIVIILLSFMMSDKLSNTKEFRARYSLRVLGMLKKPLKKRFFGFIDQWLMRLEGTSDVKVTEDEAIKRICANLKAALKIEDILNCKIMITGTAKIDNLESIFKKISVEFEDNSCKFFYSGNISYTAKTIEMIAECNAVIIVEKMGHSTHTEITKELDNINDINKKVIGVVLM